VKVLLALVFLVAALMGHGWGVLGLLVVGLVMLVRSGKRR
jgi:hypothetical protein